jgi:hypothetical protein
VAEVSKTEITITINGDDLGRYTDEFLALAWHVAQHNPAPHGDHDAGELTERIGREIIRRWLRGVPPPLWHHQGRDYYWAQLTEFAKYEPGDGPAGSPEWHAGRWVVRPEADQPPGGAG